jgi:hypothetical protein
MNNFVSGKTSSELFRCVARAIRSLTIEEAQCLAIYIATISPYMSNPAFYQNSISEILSMNSLPEDKFEIYVNNTCDMLEKIRGNSNGSGSDIKP